MRRPKPDGWDVFCWKCDRKREYRERIQACPICGSSQLTTMPAGGMSLRVIEQERQERGTTDGKDPK